MKTSTEEKELALSDVTADYVLAKLGAIQLDGQQSMMVNMLAPMAIPKIVGLIKDRTEITIELCNYGGKNEHVCNLHVSVNGEIIFDEDIDTTR
jgi:hypothetical protein